MLSVGLQYNGEEVYEEMKLKSLKKIKLIFPEFIFFHSDSKQYHNNQ